MGARRIAAFFIIVMLWSSSSKGDDRLDEQVKAAEAAIDEAVGSQPKLAGHNYADPDLYDSIYRGIVVHLFKDVDAALAAMAKLPPEHRDHVRHVQFYVPPASPDSWKLLEQLTEVESVKLIPPVTWGKEFAETKPPLKWSKELGETIPKLKHLNSLDVRNTGVDNEGIKQISKCPNLTHLWLHDNDLSKCDLAPLVNLQELVQLMMCDAEVNSTQIKFVEFLPKLKYVAISGNRIDRPTILRLREICPDWVIRLDDQKE